MAFRLRRKKSVTESLQLVAREQIDKALSELEDDSLDRNEVVHQVRKRCKKLRGLVRLVRPVFEDYSAENKDFRDTARLLSDARDAQTRLECFETLAKCYPDEFAKDRVESIETMLREQREQIVNHELNLDDLLQDFRDRMINARQRVGSWELDETGFRAIRGGLEKTFRRGINCFETARTDPSVESLHEWRKRVKYHWYHLRLLRRLWSEMFKAQRHAASKLADLLGDDHDLAVLQSTLQNASTPPSTERIFFEAIRKLRFELQRDAFTYGVRLFAEKPKSLISRFNQYWVAWR